MRLLRFLGSFPPAEPPSRYPLNSFHLPSAVIEAVVRSLVGPGDEPVEGDGHVVNGCGHGVSFPGLRSSSDLLASTGRLIPRSPAQGANAFGKPARCSSRSSTLGNPLWLRQQPDEAALDGAERAMEQDQRPAAPVDLEVHPQAVDLGVAVCSVVAHPV